MGHFFLGFDVHICSSELPPHEHYFPVAGRLQNNLKICLTYFEPKLFSWVRRDAGLACTNRIKSVISKLLIWYWTPRKIICITRWGSWLSNAAHTSTHSEPILFTHRFSTRSATSNITTSIQITPPSFPFWTSGQTSDLHSSQSSSEKITETTTPVIQATLNIKKKQEYIKKTKPSHLRDSSLGIPAPSRTSRTTRGWPRCLPFHLSHDTPPTGKMGLLRTTINFSPNHLLPTTVLLQHTLRHKVEILGQMEGLQQVPWHLQPSRSMDWLHSTITSGHFTEPQINQTSHCLLLRPLHFSLPHSSPVPPVWLHPIPYIHYSPSWTCSHWPSFRIHPKLGTCCEICLGTSRQNEGGQWDSSIGTFSTIHHDGGRTIHQGMWRTPTCGRTDPQRDCRKSSAALLQHTSPSWLRPIHMLYDRSSLCQHDRSHHAPTRDQQVPDATSFWQK